jgi:hypothetical protein
MLDSDPQKAEPVLAAMILLAPLMQKIYSVSMVRFPNRLALMSYRLPPLNGLRAFEAAARICPSADKEGEARQAHRLRHGAEARGRPASCTCSTTCQEYAAA